MKIKVLSLFSAFFSFLPNMLFSPFYADIDVFEEVFENNLAGRLII
jgi:hypothetical protein